MPSIGIPKSAKGWLEEMKNAEKSALTVNQVEKFVQQLETLDSQIEGLGGEPRRVEVAQARRFYLHRKNGAPLLKRDEDLLNEYLSSQKERLATLQEGNGQKLSF